MKKLIVVLFGILLSASVAQAQDYNTGIGVRGGLSNGLTVKHFLDSGSAIEGLVSSRWHGVNITGLYEIHNQAFQTPRLNWYYGVGGHVGFWDGSRNHPWFNDGSYTVVGIDGIIGIEYNIEPIPFNVSLDYKPALNLIGYTGFWGDEVAFSVRFIF